MTVALVTGVSGFVGANVARLLLERGRQVRALVRGSSDRGNLPVHPAFHAVPGDLRDPRSVLEAARGCSEIYHVAADYRFWAKDPRELHESNVEGTRNVMSAAEKVGAKRVVYTSTVGAIGLANQPEPCDETTAYDPGQFTSHYKRSKLEAEKVALQAAARGLPIVVVNPSTPIGPWDRKPTPTGKIIVDFVQGRMPAYVHTGLNFAPVRDVAEGHVLAAEKGRIGERYILGGQNLTMRAFLEIVAAQCQAHEIPNSPKKAPTIRVPYSIACIAGFLSTGYADWVSKQPPTVPLEAVKMSKRLMYFDSAKAVRELGYPQTPIELAVGEALEWFLEEGFFRVSRRGPAKPVTVS